MQHLKSLIGIGQVGLVAHEQGMFLHLGVFGVCFFVGVQQAVAPALQLIHDLLYLGQGIAGEVHHDEQQVGVAQKAEEAGLHVVVVDRRGINHLDEDILITQHARQGHLGSEGVVAHLGGCAGKGCHELRLASVGQSNEHRLACALTAYGVGLVLAGPAGALGVLQLLGGTGQLGAQISTQVIGALVFGDSREQLLQGGHLLGRALCGAVLLLRFTVSGREVGWHVTS